MNDTKRERGTGSIYQRGARFWIEYWAAGRRVRESAGRSESDAKKLLKRRFKEIAGNRYVGPAAEKITVGELCDALIADLKLREKKAVASFESHLKPVKESLGLALAMNLTTQRIREFIEQRQAAGKKPATVNRESGLLRQALRLALREDRINRLPHVPMLREQNTRTGFFERADFEAVCNVLDEPINDVARFAYLTGWRKGEVLPLTWAQVDRTAREVRLSDSKNGRGRVLGYDAGSDLDQLLERRWTARAYKTRDGQDGLSEYLFHREGQPVVDFRKAWTRACEAAKVPGRLFHDLRRTAARDMVRAGTPETVAMQVTGHKTRAVFDRYNICSADDVRAAIRQTATYRSTQPTERKVEPMRDSG